MYGPLQSETGMTLEKRTLAESAHGYPCRRAIARIATVCGSRPGHYH